MDEFYKAAGAKIAQSEIEGQVNTHWNEMLTKLSLPLTTEIIPTASILA